MLEGPDDGVQDQLELGRGDGQEGGEALGGGRLEEVEEMSSVFREFFKILKRREVKHLAVSVSFSIYAVNKKTPPRPQISDIICVHTHLVDHIQSALEDGIKDLGDLSGDVDSQLVDNGCHGAEHLRFTSGRDVPLVVDEYGLQQGGHKVLCHLEDRTSTC